MIIKGVDGMKAANNSTFSDAYKEGWEKLFGNKEDKGDKEIIKETTPEVDKKMKEDVLL